MKIAPLLEAARARPRLFEPILVHTGQHYDDRMSGAFFRDLGLPRPDIDLRAGSGTHARQTAKILMAFEPVCQRRKPALVVVVGDVNSTLACGLVAAKLRIPLAHVEAGLRSFDRTMPEEINRIVTDHLSDYLFTPSRDAVDNLHREGIPAGRIHLVGNIMIDTLMRFRKKAVALRAPQLHGLSSSPYGVVTLHRPSNVDDPAHLRGILEALIEISRRIPLIFPMHVRTRRNMGRFGLSVRAGNHPRLRITQPMGYLEFLGLLCSARLVLTDSGGIQEESAILGVPCLTLRENTERSITIRQGTNRLVHPEKSSILKGALEVLDHPLPKPSFPELWDGKTGQRIISILADKLGR